MILVRKKSVSRYAGVEFVLTRMITDQIELYSVLLPLFIHQATVATGRRYLESTPNPHPKSQKKNISVMEYFGIVV